MLQLLELVTLPRAYAGHLPRQLSGGQKQRVGIARALAGGVKVVVADEFVSVLDVSVPAAVTDLFPGMQRKERTTLLFGSSDLAIVRYPSEHVFGYVPQPCGEDTDHGPGPLAPLPPCTEALLSVVPIADTRFEMTHHVIGRELPAAMKPPPGCPSDTRCKRKGAVPGNLCETDVPPLRTLAPGYKLKCHLPEDLLTQMQRVVRSVGRYGGDAMGLWPPCPSSKPARSAPLQSGTPTGPLRSWTGGMPRCETIPSLGPCR